MEIGKEYIGKKLKEIRKRRGMTQKEMSQLLSVHNTYYSGMERGTCTPSLYKLVGMCTLLNVSPNYLLSNAVTDKDIPDGFESGFIRYRAKNYRRNNNMTMAEMGEVLKMSEQEYESFEIGVKPLTRGQIMGIEFLIVRWERNQAETGGKKKKNE